MQWYEYIVSDRCCLWQMMHYSSVLRWQLANKMSICGTLHIYQRAAVSDTFNHPNQRSMFVPQRPFLRSSHLNCLFHNFPCDNSSYPRVYIHTSKCNEFFVPLRSTRIKREKKIGEMPHQYLTKAHNRRKTIFRIRHSIIAIASAECSSLYGRQICRRQGTFESSLFSCFLSLSLSRRT